MGDFSVWDFDLANRRTNEWVCDESSKSEDLDLADMLATVGLGKPEPGRPLRWELTLLEIEVVSRLIDCPASGPLRRRPAFADASRRLRALSAEALGLAVTAQLAVSRHGWDKSTGWAVDLDMVRPIKGVRPDIRFRLPDGTTIAGEARGRTVTRQRLATTASPEQARRMSRLAEWAKRNDPVFMAWASASETETVVDHFFLPGPIRVGTRAESHGPDQIERKLYTQAIDLFRSATRADVGHVRLDGFPTALRGAWLPIRGLDLEVLVAALDPEYVNTGQYDLRGVDLRPQRQRDAPVSQIVSQLQETLRAEDVRRRRESLVTAVGPIVVAVRARRPER